MRLFLLRFVYRTRGGAARASSLYARRMKDARRTELNNQEVWQLSHARSTRAGFRRQSQRVATGLRFTTATALPPVVLAFLAENRAAIRATRPRTKAKLDIIIPD